MSGKPVIAVFAQSKAKARYFVDAVRHIDAEIVDVTKAHMADLVITFDHEYASSPEQQVVVMGGGAFADSAAAKTVIAMPARAADVIARVQSLLTRRDAMPERLSFAGGDLDTVKNIWQSPGQAAVRLTDKEVEILGHLHKAQGKTIGRDDLLRHVWAYASDVETHTLETHIYRLRQKIESDPAAPKILLTSDAGYFVVL